MNARSPFDRRDLDELDTRLLSRATAVIPMRDVHEGNRDPHAIALRHDCDAGHSLATAVKMARWEHEHGYRSTYFILHTSPYWRYPEFRESLERIALHGHEIGIHTNALAEGLRTATDPHLLLEAALDQLRGWGHEVVGVAAHGDRFCNYEARDGETWFNNYEQFGFRRPDYGPPDRLLTRGENRYQLDPRPLADFGLAYEAYHVGEKFWRLSDSGGYWQHDGEPPFDGQVGRFDLFMSGDVPPQQLHMLIHPDWWADAFIPAAVAA